MKKPLDHIVKEALEHLEVPYDPTSWDDMQQRIDQELGTDLDDDIKSTVADLHVGYQHKHWLQLKEWLDFTWYASNKIYISKAAECGLMLLALFTFFNYVGNGEYNRPEPIAENIPTEMQVSPTNISETDNDLKLDVAASTDYTEVGENSKSDDFQGQLPSEKNQIGQETDNNRSQSNISFLPAAANPVVDAQKVIITDENNYTAVINEAEVIESNTAENGPEIKTGQLENATSKSIQDLVALESASSIDQLVLSNILPVVSQENSKPVVPVMVALHSQGEKNWAVSAFSDLGFNHISTPYDELYEKSGYNQNRIGIGGGLRVHRDFGPVELSAGLTYSSLKYNPKEFIELFKRSPESEGTVYRFEGIELNLLSVPIHANYYINKTGKWHAYIAAGGAIHLALQAEYEKDAELVPGALPIPEFVDENEGATVTVGRTPNFEKKKFPDGLLENGSFKDNHYFTLDLGIGVERKISKSTSVFAQPTVYYNLFDKGLSANNDKINTFTLQLGAKTKF